MHSIFVNKYGCCGREYVVMQNYRTELIYALNFELTCKKKWIQIDEGPDREKKYEKFLLLCCCSRVFRIDSKYSKMTVNLMCINFSDLTNWQHLVWI